MVVGLDPYFDDIYFLSIGYYTLGGDDMPQVCDLSVEELTFQGFEFKSSLFGPHEMAGWIFQEDDYIFEVYYAPVEIEVPEAGLHQLPKGGRGVGQSERHSITFIDTQQPYCKHGQWFALLFHLDLPVQTSGQVRRTTETPANYRGSYQCGVAGRHP